MVTDKKKTAVIILSVLLLALVILTIVFWKEIYMLLEYLLNGTTVVKEYILSLGYKAVIAMMMLLILLFFFPIISSLPIQMLAIIAYGVWGATALVAVSLAIASQIVYLINRNYTYLTDSPKKRQKREELENKIKNSRLNIYVVLFLAYAVPGIPFILISSVAAVSRIKWWKYTLFTLIGPIPEIVVTLLIGNQVVNSTPLASAIMLGVIIALVILSLLFKDKIVDFVFRPKKEATPTNTEDKDKD